MWRGLVVTTLGGGRRLRCFSLAQLQVRRFMHTRIPDAFAEQEITALRVFKRLRAIVVKREMVESVSRLWTWDRGDRVVDMRKQVRSRVKMVKTRRRSKRQRGAKAEKGLVKIHSTQKEATTTPVNTPYRTAPSSNPPNLPTTPTTLRKPSTSFPTIPSRQNPNTKPQNNLSKKQGLIRQGI